MHTDCMHTNPQVSLPRDAEDEKIKVSYAIRNTQPIHMHECMLDPYIKKLSIATLQIPQKATAQMTI